MVCKKNSSNNTNADKNKNKNNLGVSSENKRGSSGKENSSGKKEENPITTSAVKNGATFLELNKAGDGDKKFGWVADMLRNLEKEGNKNGEKTTAGDVMAKLTRELKRQGTPITRLTTAEIWGEAPTNFDVKKEAEICLFTGYSSSSKNNVSRYSSSNKNVPPKLGHLNYEKEYKAYYDELVANEEEWMAFFDKTISFYDAK